MLRSSEFGNKSKTGADETGKVWRYLYFIWNSEFELFTIVKNHFWRNSVIGNENSSFEEISAQQI
jgi:hypothetical protein